MRNEMQLQEGWEHVWDLKKKKRMKRAGKEKKRGRKRRGGEERALDTKAFNMLLIAVKFHLSSRLSN